MYPAASRTASRGNRTDVPQLLAVDMNLQAAAKKCKSLEGVREACCRHMAAPCGPPQALVRIGEPLLSYRLPRQKVLKEGGSPGTIQEPPPEGQEGSFAGRRCRPFWGSSDPSTFATTSSRAGSRDAHDRLSAHHRRLSDF